ncbi:MAG: type II toxin-antitoxin system VapC family toxin [Parvularculaceae bacterium]
MARFVIDLEAALRLLDEEAAPAAAHRILAPSLLRSQVPDALYGRVRRGETSREAALRANARFAKAKHRYLGDAVLRRRAFELALRLDMASTFDAEFIALTQLQGDALIAGNAELAAVARKVVTVRPFKDLFG